MDRDQKSFLIGNVSKNFRFKENQTIMEYSGCGDSTQVLLAGSKNFSGIQVPATDEM